MTLKWIAYIIILTLIFTSGCSDKQYFGSLQSPEETSLSAPLITEQVLEIYEPLLNFNAMVTLKNEFGKINEQVFYQPPKYRIEYLSPSEKNGDIVVFDGDIKWHYVNATNEALWISAEYENFTFPEEYSAVAIDYLELIIGMLTDYEWISNGTSSENGDIFYIIEYTDLTPVTDAPYPVSYPIYSVRLWIEKDTWIIKKAESFSKSGKIILSADYSDVVINDEIQKETFVFHTPKGADIKPMGTVAITPPREQIETR